MRELDRILRSHGEKYPLMQPADAVKLLYQNEFGGGHLIRDEAACLDYLRAEYAAVAHDAAAPLWEDIGSGILRVNLAALPRQDLDRLGRAFLRSAAARTGDMARFQEKLTVLAELTAAGVFAFGPEALEEYLAAYRAAGCPAVSHSPQYRAAYHPAYRVILKTERWE